VRHEHPVHLRWSDPDSYGHVNHARVLSLFEDARLAWAAVSPGVVAGEQPGIILARLEVDYLRQLYYRVGEELTVRSWLVRLGTTSITMRQELLQDGEVAIRLDAVCVAFDHATASPRPLTGSEREHWTTYLED
jgi:acyl-CoA thioester hydrolase